MAQVTVELMNILKIPTFKLFDFEYQFDDLTFKAKLENYIQDFYYEYEIAGETIEEFKHRFKTRWLRIVPYYNSIYNTTLISYNPLINNKSTESGVNDSEVTNNGTASTTNSGTDTTKNVGEANSKKSDYPQQPIVGSGFLSGEDNATNSNTNTYTAGTKNDNTNHLSSVNNSTYEKSVEGISGITYAELIKQHRSTILRLQDDIIKEMKPCFILVY